MSTRILIKNTFINISVPLYSISRCVVMKENVKYNFTQYSVKKIRYTSSHLYKDEEKEYGGNALQFTLTNFCIKGQFLMVNVVLIFVSTKIL